MYVLYITLKSVNLTWFDVYMCWCLISWFAEQLNQQYISIYVPFIYCRRCARIVRVIFMPDISRRCLRAWHNVYYSSTMTIDERRVSSICCNCILLPPIHYNMVHDPKKWFVIADDIGSAIYWIYYCVILSIYS